MSTRALIVLASCAFACVPEATAPPVMPMTFAPPTVLDRGRTGISAHVAIRALAGESPLDSWSVSARHGFGDGWEGTMDASYLHETSSLRTVETSSGVSLRSGFRYHPDRFGRRLQFALFGGGGAGPYDGGTLIGGDFGLTLGTDSLFFTTRLSVSGAVSARIVDDGDYVPISLCILFCDTPAPVEYRNSPHVMGALETMLGLRARFSDSDPSSFVLGLELVQSVTPVAYRLGPALGTSVEVVF